MSAHKSKKRKAIDESAKFYETPKDDLAKEIQDSISKNKVFEFKIKQEFKYGPRHIEYLKTMQDPNNIITIVDGLAGTAKTLIATHAALALLKRNEVEQIIYVRSAVESASRSLGFLPGEMEDKFGPFLEPLKDKLRELVEEPAMKFLLTTNSIEAVPINFARGRTFKNAFIIVDEVQNFTTEEILTIMSRIGKGSRMAIIGDTMQADIGNKSGFARMCAQFESPCCVERGIHVLRFGKSEVVRHELIGFITDRFKVNPVTGH